MMFRMLSLVLTLGFPVLAPAGEVSGVASYRERIALPPEARFRASLVDVSAGERVEIALIEAPGNSGPPYRFTINYDDTAIHDTGHYAIRAEIIWPDHPYFEAETLLEDFPALMPVIDLVMLRDRVSDTEQAELDGGLDASGQASDVAPDGRTLGGMMTYFADAALFEDCASGQRFPVSQSGDYLTLERAYVADRSGPGEPLFVLLDGSIRKQPGMEGPDRPTLVIDRFIRTRPETSCARQMADSELQNTYWRLDHIANGSVPRLAETREPHLVLEAGETPGFRAMMGCNRMRGSFDLSGESLRFGPAASTLMACPDDLADLERRFAQMLSQVSAYTIKGETLVLRNQDRDVLATFSAVYF